MKQYRTIEQMCSDAHSITLRNGTFWEINVLEITVDGFWLRNAILFFGKDFLETSKLS